MTLPPAVSEAISAVQDEELKSCREAAESLAKRLKAKKLQTRLVSGLLLDQGHFLSARLGRGEARQGLGAGGCDQRRVRSSRLTRATCASGPSAIFRRGSIY